MQLNIAEINLKSQIIFRNNSLNNSLNPTENGLRSGWLIDSHAKAEFDSDKHDALRYGGSGVLCIYFLSSFFFFFNPEGKRPFSPLPVTVL